MVFNLFNNKNHGVKYEEKVMENGYCILKYVESILRYERIKLFLLWITITNFDFVFFLHEFTNGFSLSLLRLRTALKTYFHTSKFSTTFGLLPTSVIIDANKKLQSYQEHNFYCRRNKIASLFYERNIFRQETNFQELHHTQRNIRRIFYFSV